MIKFPQQQNKIVCSKGTGLSILITGLLATQDNGKTNMFIPLRKEQNILSFLSDEIQLYKSGEIVSKYLFGKAIVAEIVAEIVAIGKACGHVGIAFD